MPAPSISDSINAVVQSAPELGKSPGLVVDIAAAGAHVANRAQAVGRTSNALGDAKAQQNTTRSVGSDLSDALNWLGQSVAHVGSKVVHGAETVASTAGSAIGKLLNTPLSIAEHEYRYLHDVEARHGTLPALLEGLGIAAGAGAGFLGGGIYGAGLGAETAAGLEGQVFYRDSWSRTASASYTDPHTHLHVSPGTDLLSFVGSHLPRDTAKELGLRPGSTVFKIGSGLVDAIAMLALPVGGNELMGLAGEARSAEGAAGILGNYFPGISAATAEDFEQAYLRYPSVRRAMADIAGKSAGEIVATPAYRSLRIIPRLTTNPNEALTTSDFIRALGYADDADQVADVFRDVLRTHELVGMDKVPTLSFTRVPFQALREYAENQPGVAGRVARFFSEAPSAVDNATGAISRKVFDPTNPFDDGALGLYRMVRYAEDRRTAASVVDAYINGNLADKVLIYRNATMNTLLAMSEHQGFDTGKLTDLDLQEIKKALDNFTGGAEPGAEGWYGVSDTGRNLSYVRDADQDGRQYAAAITDNQTGKLRFIQLNEMRTAARELAGYRGVFGQVAKADDFLYNHVTQALFKPIVLLTPSYALHIALAELIPNTLRLGLRRMVADGLAINAAKLGEKMMDEDAEVSAITGLTWKLLGTKIQKALTEHPEDLTRFERRIQLAARYIEAMGGDTVAPGLAAGHNLSSEVDRVYRQTTALRTVIANTPLSHGRDFGLFGRADDGYLDAWYNWLNVDLVRDEKTRLAARRMAGALRSGRDVESASRDAAGAVSAWLHDRPADYLNRYLRGQSSTQLVDGDRLPGTDQLDDWAQIVVENLRGATRAANHGPMNLELLDKIGNGEHVALDDLSSIEERLRPANVKGRKIVPAPPENFVRNLADRGFRSVLNPMVNFISREPIAFAEFERQYARQVPLIEAGLTSEDQAMVTALARTSQIVIRNVHNLADRTQWTETLRNVAPFWFAQEQAYRRMGRLLASDPLAFRKYQLMITAAHDVGQIAGGANGQNYFVVPHTGWLTPTFVSGASRFFPITGSSPVGMGWNLNSMSVIFPTSNGVRPDLGPVIAVPVQAIADFFPEMGAPSLKADVTAAGGAILGSSAMSAPIWEQLVPNTIIERLMEAANGGQFVPDRSFDSTVMQTMAAMDYEGLLPQGPGVTPVELQQAADRIINQTRIWYIAKALIGAITPVSPEIQVSGASLKTEYDADAAAWDLATEPGAGSLKSQDFSMNDLGFPKELNDDIRREGSLVAGIHAYLAKHPDATAASVFEQAVPGGAPFTVSQSGTPGGAYLTASVQAENWINDHFSLFTNPKYAPGAIYLMPQLTDTKYNATIYNEQLAQGFRVKLSPNQYTANGELPSFINQLYIAAGNVRFFGSIYPKYLASISGLPAAARYPLEQTFYNVTLPQFERQNPIWGQWWTSDTREQERQAAIVALQNIYRDGVAPPSPMNADVQAILAGYENHVSRVNALTVANQSTTAENDAWEGYLVSMAQAHPQALPFISSVFLTIPTSTVSGATNG